MHGEPDSGGSEGVSDAEGAAPVVQLLHWDPANLLLQAEVVLAEVVRVQRVDVGQKLRTGKIEFMLYFLSTFLKT